MRSTVKRGPRTKLVKQMHMRAEMQRMAVDLLSARVRSFAKLPDEPYQPWPLRAEPSRHSKTEFDGFI